MMFQCAGEGTSQAIIFTLVNSLEVIDFYFFHLFVLVFLSTFLPSFLLTLYN